MLVWRYVGRFMESRFFRTKIKRDIPSESLGDWNGDDFPWTDEVHAGTAAFRLPILFALPLPRNRASLHRKSKNLLPWSGLEPVWRRRGGGGGPCQAMGRSVSFPCPKVQEAMSRSENFLICVRSSCLI